MVPSAQHVSERREGQTAMSSGDAGVFLDDMTKARSDGQSHSLLYGALALTKTCKLLASWQLGALATRVQKQVDSEFWIPFRGQIFRVVPCVDADILRVAQQLLVKEHPPGTISFIHPMLGGCDYGELARAFAKPSSCAALLLGAQIQP